MYQCKLGLGDKLRLGEFVGRDGVIVVLCVLCLLIVFTCVGDGVIIWLIFCSPNLEY